MGAENWTPLIMVAVGDNRDADAVAVAKLLLEAGADIDADDGFGATALLSALTWDRESLALYLISRGAKVNTKLGVYIDNPSDVTPLHYATKDHRIVRALLAHGADVKARASDGRTPLHWAALGRNGQSATLLLRAGADIDAADEHGWTPLHWAAMKGHAAAVQVLLAHGAERAAKDKYGVSPLERAHNDEIGRLLRSGGANP